MPRHARRRGPAASDAPGPCTGAGCSHASHGPAASDARATPGLDELTDAVCAAYASGSTLALLDALANLDRCLHVWLTAVVDRAHDEGESWRTIAGRLGASVATVHAQHSDGRPVTTGPLPAVRATSLRDLVRRRPPHTGGTDHTDNQ